ncbi:hypothetical protein LCGC14_1763000 [marine sediment metagenome]|uniref:Uncharacterized protein n=1 Tax=marine sediment metagenome TaxID=412755 RepID=A0A0F9H0F0_9ZZZZ
MDFKEGQQPCQDFKPQIEANEHAMWENRHECYKCSGTVSFCENCYWDHHEGGYEKCVIGETNENGAG